ncbi:unnamed protein product [Cercopithifilaria johnstoni]|uniref:Uncharacterized protein n=1 Tax=Cercopithifilaria johnstoni TaxID=2874296 RepID=A0A8J2Q766_9BILA|nr:unnamed protein product [Cercopithifilaria johnstoni]
MLRKSRSDSDKDIFESDEENLNSVIKKDVNGEKKIPKTKYVGQAMATKTNELQIAILREIAGEQKSVAVDGIGQLNAKKYPVLLREFLEKDNANKQDMSELISGKKIIQKESLRSVGQKVTINNNIMNVKSPTNGVFVVRVSIILISGVLRVRIRRIRTTQGILLMDSGSESESIEGAKVSDSMESEIEEGNVGESSGPRRPCYPAISNLEVISIITELMNFQYRKEYRIVFENVKDMKQYLGIKFLCNRYYFLLNNIFDIGTYLDNSSQAEIIFVKELYENIVRTVLLYSRMKGFLLLRCIIDNPSFPTAIYEKADVIREMSFLKSLYNEVRKSVCLKRQRGRKEFISCSFLFDVVKLIKKNETRKLLERGVIKTEESCDFFYPDLFTITADDVEQLYETDLAIITHFDLLTQYRFFKSSLHTAQRTLQTKPLVVTYANIRIQLSFFKLLARHIKTLDMENLDKLTDFKLSSEENRKDDCCYNILQAQEMIRSEFTMWKGARKAFRFLPTLTEYLVGRKEPKNKTSLNLYYFIKEFLMVIPHEEFIGRHYGFIIAQLCMSHESHSSILNPATVINRILIPNLKRPIRKICAAIVLGNLLQFRRVNIAWSFDYTAQDTKYYDDDNITSQTDEKVEVMQLIGAFYSQYTFPQRSTIRCTRYLFIDLVLSRLESRLNRLMTENSFTPNALRYLDELVAKKKFSWQADYYLSKILLRNLLTARVVKIPERPIDETNRQAWIEWIAKLFPITYAGVKSKPFFALAFLIDGYVNNLDLESAFVLHFDEIPEFSFIEFLILFKILMRSNKNSRITNFCRHSPENFGSNYDKSLREMVKWLFRVINRVQKSGGVNENAILKAKHRVLQWAEAYVANSKVIGTDDTRAILSLLKWKDEPGLKDDELDRGMNRLFYEVCHKCTLRTNDPVLEIIQQWSPCENILEDMEYYLNHIPPSRPSEVKVYNPTRLLLYKSTRPDELTPWEQCQFKKFLHETIDFQRLGGGSRMRNRARSGPGMYGYARPLYVWSVDGLKPMPYSSMKNDYEDVPSDLSKLNEKKNLPFDLQAEVGSVWLSGPSRYPEFTPQMLPKRHTSSQSVNIPIIRDEAYEIFRMQIAYDPFIPIRRNFDNELGFGASAANFRRNADTERRYSLPCDLSNLNLRTEKIVPGSSKPQVPMFKVQKQRFRTRQRRTQIKTTDVMKKAPIRRSNSRETDIKVERTLFHPFLENIGSCSICGLIDHAENFCPDTPNYSNLLNTLMPVTYKWMVKKEKSFENFHRQDSWGCFGDDDN